MNRTALRTIAQLLRGGLTLAEIERLDEAEMLAWSVAMGEAEGGEFDWARLRWRERDR